MIDHKNEDIGHLNRSMNLAKTLARAGRYAEALFDYEAAIWQAKRLKLDQKLHTCRVERALTLCEFGDPTGLILLEHLIKEAMRQYDQATVAHAKASYLLGVLCSHQTLNHQVINPVAHDLIDGAHEEDQVMILAVLILMETLRGPGARLLFKQVLLSCTCLPLRPHVIEKAYHHLGEDDPEIRDWMKRYWDPLKAEIAQERFNWSLYLEERPLLKPCDFFRCEALCCYDGVYLEAGEKDMVMEVVATYPEYFNHLPDDPIIGANWRGLVQGDKTQVRPHAYEHPDFPKHFEKTRCVFAYDNGICSLQVAATRHDRHPWRFKPRACWLFPIKGYGDMPIAPPLREEVDPDFVDQDYPGYTKFLPCGQEDDDGLCWSQIFEQEIRTMAYLDRLKEEETLR